MVEAQLLTDSQCLVLPLLAERDRQCTEVYQVLPMNAREALGDDHGQAQVPRRERRMLSARTLAVVAPRDDDVGAAGPGPGHVALVDRRETEVGDAIDVAAEW